MKFFGDALDQGELDLVARREGAGEINERRIEREVSDPVLLRHELVQGVRKRAVPMQLEQARRARAAHEPINVLVQGAHPDRNAATAGQRLQSAARLMRVFDEQYVVA